MKVRFKKFIYDIVENQDEALEILKGVENRIPGGLEAYMQAIGIERRRGNISGAEKLFLSTLDMLKERKDKVSFGQMTIKFARFLTLVSYSG